MQEYFLIMSAIRILFHPLSKSHTFIVLFVCMFPFLKPAHAQTFSAGDIAFLGFNSDNPDEFSFILMNYFNVDDTIYFTDCGWNGSNLYTAEGHIKWVPPAAGLPGGSIITITSSVASGLSDASGNATASASSGTVLSIVPEINASNNGMELNTDGDQIIAYKKTGSVINYIACLNFNGSYSWSIINSSEQTLLPPGLTNGTNAIVLSDKDNAIINCNLLSTIPTVAEFNNSANWLYSNDPRFTLPPIVVCDFILPVELNQFYAITDNSVIHLYWSTVSEINNDYFLIEKSKDGNSFYSIGTVDAVGNSTSASEYQFTDDHPLQGNNYYRLRQVDFSGSSANSEIIVIQYSQFNIPEILVYPFASQNIIHLNLSSTPLQIMLYNEAGVFIKNIDLNLNTSQNQIDISSLAQGMYLLRIYFKNEIRTAKFVKL